MVGIFAFPSPPIVNLQSDLLFLQQVEKEFI